MHDLRQYKQLELSLVTDLHKLLELAVKHQASQAGQDFGQALERLQGGNFRLAVVGEFKRGKSTLINALLGQDIFPTDVLPTTATLNRLVYSLEEGVELHFHDGRSERIPLERLRDYVTKLDPEAEERAAQIREAVVYFPCPYCRNQVELLDTPGLQDERAMTDVTMQVLPSVDAAVLVISALSPLSESEMAFLSQLGGGSCARVFLVVSSIDRLEGPEQVDRLIKGLQQRIARLEPGVRATLHPEIFPVSAYQALEGRQNRDPEKIRQSRMAHFERSLETFLSVERGVATLLGPVQQAQQALVSLRQQLQRQIQAWQARDAELQARKREIDRPPVAEAPTRIELAELNNFLAQEPTWKRPIREVTENLSSHIARITYTDPNAPSNWFASLKTSLDPQAREHLPKALFEILKQALLDGQSGYRNQLLFTLDRQWDDLLDRQPQAAPPLAGRGLERNQQLADELAQLLEQKLRLEYTGGFVLSGSWGKRPDLWMLKNREGIPLVEIRRELETALIEQLSVDLGDTLRSWKASVEAAYQELLPAPAKVDSSQPMRDWVRDSVLLEKEQAELRQDWDQLQSLDNRLQALRAQLQALQGGATNPQGSAGKPA